MIARAGLHRRGMIYVLVLTTAAIVAVIGLSALTVVRVQRRGCDDIADLGKARLYARSAVEWGLHELKYDEDWRSSRPNGVWTNKQAIGDGAFTVSVIDPNDGDIGNRDNDPVTITGWGYAGEASHCMRVQLDASATPLTCLEVAMQASGNLVIGSATIISDQTIATNATASASGAYVFADVEAASNITGGTYYGTNTSGVPARTMPDSSVFDQYIADGTNIPLSELKKSGSVRILEDVTLSPTSSPFSTGPNADGIYVIDCSYAIVRVRDVHVEGTLVLLDSSLVSVEGSVDWKPAVENYPALLIRGSATIKYDDDTLDGAPSKIAGIVYVTGNTTISNAVTVEGALISGARIDVSGTFQMFYNSAFYQHPPPGFGEEGGLRIVPGSWAPVVTN